MDIGETLQFSYNQPEKENQNQGASIPPVSIKMDWGQILT